MAGNETRAVFFDIDGTIWNRENEIPPSTAAAVAALKRRGHLVLLCSGRTRGYIRAPELLSLDFDGIISGCGTMLEFGGETLFYHRIPTPLLERTLNTVRSFGFRPILEGREYLYFDEAEFGGDPYGEKLRAELGARLKTICGS
ncbi:MAG: HAD hydrolase family protein [Oscillospiraceae bacterium]|nr:HAD hydrolase family protein [Oscillospiraceae bacterium]